MTQRLICPGHLTWVSSSILDSTLHHGALYRLCFNTRHVFLVKVYILAAGVGLLLPAPPGPDGGPPERGAPGSGPAHGEHHGQDTEIIPVSLPQGGLGDAEWSPPDIGGHLCPPSPHPGPHGPVTTRRGNILLFVEIENRTIIFYFQP